MRALVITPTTGAPELVDAIESVRNQTVKTDHLLVVDGEKFSTAVDILLRSKLGSPAYGEQLFRCDLPFNTGGGGFYGHRVMAAFSHLVNHDYVLFLDQDNWFEPTHVESLINTIETFKVDWSYSLRKIYDKDKNFICDDNCESLGRWPVWVNDQAYLIDSSSYCFKTPFIRQFGHIWDHGWGADRRFYTIIKDQLKHQNYQTTGKHTLCYRLGGNEGSVQKEFFIEGNSRTQETYKEYETYPWLS